MSTHYKNIYSSSRDKHTLLNIQRSQWVSTNLEQFVRETVKIPNGLIIKVVRYQTTKIRIEPIYGNSK